MPRFEYDDLIQKQKDELDKIKTAVDIYQSEDKYDFERKKFRTENFRFFSIAILTAIISLGSSYIIESFKQRNASIIESSKYANASKENLRREYNDFKKMYIGEKEKDIQIKLACVLAHFDNTINDNNIENEKKEFNEICVAASNIKEQKETISNIDTSPQQVKDALVKINNYDRDIQTLKQQRNAAPPAEKTMLTQKITEVNNNIESLVNTVPEIKKAVTLSDNIEKDVRQIVKINTNIEAQQSATTTRGEKSKLTWFKEGYFLQFENFRITLQYLDKNVGIQVGICVTKNGSDCEKEILTKKWVKFNSPLEFKEDGKVYRINLEAIDHAGKNPFTLAAYITFESIINQ
jgi:hypothetical protein